ncbi:LysE family translocator [Conexibacter woesei]|uniref:LysE family translocator n=1 Tax=Conexibacter woesei TaxID=191495 RepID=UPI00040DAD7C|nr:LysE family translocator [Conexibacter woesei]
MASLWSFLLAALVLVALPGPATTLVMKNALTRGPRSALVTSAGVFSADLVWMAASVVGLTAVLVASAPAFTAIRLIGAAYLVFIGVRLLLARGAFGEEPAAGESRAAVVPVPARRAFREGLLCDLSNPKTLLVFTSVIPQFLGHDASPLDLAAFGLVFATAGLASLVAYTIIFSRARRATRHPRVRTTLLRLGGAILIAFGIRVAVESP